MALPAPGTSILVFTTAVTTASLYAILNRVVYPRRPAVLRSPLASHISRLSPEEKSELLYPPNFFPGARDVSTPYGSVRCCTFKQPGHQRAHTLRPSDPFIPYTEVVVMTYLLTCLDEFGPATGRKVLLVHGISTSCSE